LRIKYSPARDGLTHAGYRYPHLWGRYRNPHCLTCGAGCTCCGCGADAGWEIICAGDWVLSQSMWT